MQQTLIVTADGSHSVKISPPNLLYHSIHGAIQESQHVYIEAGLRSAIDTFGENNINVFEMGFGTGLNALLTYLDCQARPIDIYYESVELNPINIEIFSSLNYC